MIFSNYASERKIPTMLTIKELAKESKQFGVTEFHIRHAVNEGLIPHINAGRKILINRDKFIDYLEGVQAGEKPGGR